MLPDFITDKSKIAKYTYKDIEEIFLDNYEEVLKKYIAAGNPSADTTKNYFGRIRAVLSWCKDNDFEPLRLQEQHIILYRDFLLKENQKPTTIAAKLTASVSFITLLKNFISLPKIRQKMLKRRVTRMRRL